MPEIDPADKSREAKLKIWSELRGVIVHEDNLVNQRLTWLFTSEAFLLGAFGVIQSAVVENKMTTAAVIGAEMFLILIMLGAVWICYITGRNISAAYQQVHAVKLTWELLYPEEKAVQCEVPGWFLPRPWKASSSGNRGGALMPPIRGEYNYGIGITQRIPGILLTLDIMAIAVCVLIVYAAEYHPHLVYKVQTGSYFYLQLV